MAQTSVNIDVELKDRLLATAAEISEKENIKPKLSIHGLIYKMHEHFLATYLKDNSK